ncbi:MAG TPA: HEAT repeat domain-containing protein [Myxococcaceae bacterium]|nr:HEAT repeat domain-containing protein [Myxococcaceae bacterium]
MSDWDHQRDAALLQLAAAKDAHQRVTALDDLLALAVATPPERKQELISDLATHLADRDGGVRAAALSLAGELLPTEELIPLLGERLADEDVRVRVEAASQLADLVRPELRGSLARALQDEAYEVRFEAARGMASLKHPAGLDLLVEALNDSEWRFRALGALGELADPRCVPAVRRTFRRWFLNVFERARAATVLALVGEADGANYLVKRLRKRWSFDRAIVAEMVGEARIESARELLLTMLHDPKEPARGAAARGLGRMGGEGAYEVLTTMLERPGLEEDERMDVLEGLCLLRTGQAHRKVEEQLAKMEWSEDKAELQAWLEACARDMRG